MSQTCEKPKWKFPQRVFVISDLHLGGRGASADNSRPDFRICGRDGQKKLKHFIDFVRDKHTDTLPSHLVINGDFVDFLAEEDRCEDGFADFTRSETDAFAKFERICTKRLDAGGDDRGDGNLGCQEVFAALTSLVAKGAYLTILLGNHDLELAWPSLKKYLLDKQLSADSRRVYIPNDGLPLQLGELYIDHGNRLDFWNRVNYPALMRFTRGEYIRFEAPLGSELVVKFMNKIKKRYDFIDLLKPEKATALPLFWFLADTKLRKELQKKHLVLPFVFRFLYQTLFGGGDQSGKTRSGSEETKYTVSEEEKLLDGFQEAYDAILVREESTERTQQDCDAQGLEIALPTGIDQLEKVISWLNDMEGEAIPSYSEKTAYSLFKGFYQMPLSAMSEAEKLNPDIAPEDVSATQVSDAERKKILAKRREALRRALLSFFDDNPHRLSIYSDDNDYARSALNMKDFKFDSRYSCKVVVYGHTHILNRIDSGDFSYFNTGTFADLMLLPESVLSAAPSAAAERVLDQFLAELSRVMPSAAELPTHDKTDPAQKLLYAIRRSMPGFAEIELSSDLRVVNRRLAVLADEAGRDIDIPHQDSGGARELKTLWDLARKIDETVRPGDSTAPPLQNP